MTGFDRDQHCYVKVEAFIAVPKGWNRTDIYYSVNNALLQHFPDAYSVTIQSRGD